MTKYNGRWREQWDRVHPPDPAPVRAPTCRWCGGEPGNILHMEYINGTYCCSEQCAKEERAAEKAIIEYARAGDGTWYWSLVWKCPACRAFLSITGGRDEGNGAPPPDLFARLRNPRDWVAPANCRGCLERRQDVERQHAARAR